MTVQGRYAPANISPVSKQPAWPSLATFPQRGTKRDDLAPGIRIIGFERRATIAFRVEDDTVRIVRIFYGGRNYETYFHGLEEDD